MSLVSTPMSIGELLDKITILEIKAVKISDEAKLKNINYELDLLSETWADTKLNNGKIDELKAALKTVNQKLWHIEDQIRILEKHQQFDDEFIELARSVYFVNDDRANIKKEINTITGSALVEEKSYESYQ